MRTAVIILMSLAVAIAAGVWAVPTVRGLLDDSPDDYDGPGSGEVTIEIPLRWIHRES